MTGGQWASRPSRGARHDQEPDHPAPADSRSGGLHPPGRRHGAVPGRRAARGPRASCRGHVRPGERRGRRCASCATRWVTSRSSPKWSRRNPRACHDARQVVRGDRRQARIPPVLHGSAQGKVALAFGDESLRRGVPLAPRTADPENHRQPGGPAQGARPRAAPGLGGRPNEALIGVNALAAPVFGATGALVGTVAIVDSIQFIEEEPTAEQVERVREAGGGFRPRSVTRARARFC